MKYITNYFSFCTLAHSEDLIEKKVNDYGHEIPQSHTADLPTTPWGSTTEQAQSQDIRKTIS